MSVSSFLIKCASTKRIFEKYGQRYTSLQIAQLNKWMRVREKMHRLSCSTKFLKNCIINKIAPMFLTCRIRKAKVKHSSSVERMFLNDEIGKNLDEVDRLRELYRNIGKEYSIGSLNWII